MLMIYSVILVFGKIWKNNYFNILSLDLWKRYLYLKCDLNKNIVVCQGGGVSNKYISPAAHHLRAVPKKNLWEEGGEILNPV